MDNTDCATDALRYLGLGRYSIDIRQFIQNIADDDAEFLDIDSIEVAYRAKMQAILPDGLTLKGNNICGTRAAFVRVNRSAIIDAAQSIDLIELFDYGEDD